MFGLFFLLLSATAWWFVHPGGSAASLVLWLLYQRNQNFRANAARGQLKQPSSPVQAVALARRLATAGDRSATMLMLLFGWGVLGGILAVFL